jgi:hypothetical protein
LNEILLASLVSALLIAIAHWFPWRVLFHRSLRRTEAYALGLTAILAPALTVLWLRGDMYAIAIIVACTLAAGITTIATKSIDVTAAHRNELQDRRNRD